MEWKSWIQSSAVVIAIVGGMWALQGTIHETERRINDRMDTHTNALRADLSALRSDVDALTGRLDPLKFAVDKNEEGSSTP